MKLVSHLPVKKKHCFDQITVSRNGELSILSEKRCQNVYIINKYNLNSEDREEELKLFWGMGQIGKEDVVSLSSPAVHERMCSLGAANSFKLWNFRGKERTVIFEEKMSQLVTEVAMHPSGLLVAVNCTSEIKLMSLLPTGIY